MRSILFFFILFVGLFVGQLGQVEAQTVYDWNVAAGTPADWNVDDNWTSAFGDFVPNGEFDESARINNGGTAVIGGVVPNVLDLTVSNGTVLIENGGSLEVLGNVSATGNGLLHLTGNGKLTVEGNASNSARITGPNVQYQVGGDYSSRGTLIAEITGDSHSAIDVTGTANLGGVLQVELSGVDPAFGQSWPLLSAAEVTGDFANVNVAGATLPRGLRFATSRSGGDVSLTVDNALLLSINRLTGAGAIENPIGGAVEFVGYSINSAGGLVGPGNWTSLMSSGAGGAGWEEANPQSTHLSELNLTGSASLAVGGKLDLGAPYVPGPQTPDQEDVVFQYVTEAGQLVQGLVEFVGPANDLVLTVNPDTGEAAISNLSPFFSPPNVKGYSIISDSGSLTPASWSSFQDSGNAGAGWEEANPMSEHLSELNLDGSTPFTTNTLISLGNIYTPDSPRDLVFEYFTEAGGVLPGRIEYGEIPDVMTGSRGDFNMDGVVDLQDIDLLATEIAGSTNNAAFDLNADSLVNDTDLNLFLGDNIITSGNKLNGDADFGGDVQFSDFVVLSENFAQTNKKWSEGDFDASGDVQFSDFVILAENFGQSAGQAVAATVPEPCGLWLATLAMVGLCGMWRRGP